MGRSRHAGSRGHTTNMISAGSTWQCLLKTGYFKAALKHGESLWSAWTCWGPGSNQGCLGQ